MHWVFFTIALALVARGISLEQTAPRKEHLNAFSKSIVTFTLFTRDNPDRGTKLPATDPKSLKKAGFSNSTWTFILAAGWNSEAFTPWTLNVKSSLLEKYKCNVIIADWTRCSLNFNYVEVIETCLYRSTHAIADLLEDLQRVGASHKEVHLIGHSLGAHLIGGIVSFGVKPGRITGLDPAIFNTQFARLPFPALNKNKADFVDVIHTNRLLGSVDIHGHTDFIINGAQKQPVCSHLVSVFVDCCDHQMATEYFAEAVVHPKKFPAKKCPKLENALTGKDCSKSTINMEFPVNRENKGFYAVKTDWKNTYQSKNELSKCRYFRKNTSKGPSKRPRT